MRRAVRPRARTDAGFGGGALARGIRRLARVRQRGSRQGDVGGRLREVPRSRRRRRGRTSHRRIADPLEPDRARGAGPQRPVDANGDHARSRLGVDGRAGRRARHLSEGEPAQWQRGLSPSPLGSGGEWRAGSSRRITSGSGSSTGCRPSPSS